MRKIILLTLILVIISAQVICVSAAEFWDVSQNHWAYAEIMELADKGILNGYGNGAFSPEEPITRAEWAKVLCSAAMLNPEDQYQYMHVALGNTHDVNPSHWAAKYFLASGAYFPRYRIDGVDYMFPDAPVTREEAAASLARIKGYNSYNVDESFVKKFTDDENIAKGFWTPFCVAVQDGIIKGDERGFCYPKYFLTRAEAAAIISRTEKLYVNSSSKSVNGGLLEYSTFWVLNQADIGPIDIDESAENLLEPESKGKEWLQGATGDYLQDWNYPSLGITLSVSRESGSSKRKVTFINVKAPCPYVTNHGIGIGSTWDEVVRAYKREIDFTNARGENSLSSKILVGSIYGGIIFNFENDRVSNISIGAFAE